MEKIAYSKKIKKRPKWLETFHINFMKNFPDCSEDLSQSLLEILNNKVKDVSTTHNRKKLKALFEIVRDLFLHFYWKIRWKGKKMWKKYWIKDYSKTFNYDFRTKCVAKLLYFIIYIGIKLSTGASDSRWISRILQAVHILSDYSIVYTSLLMVHKLKKKYHRSYCAILKKVLIIKFPKCILDPVVYIKIMILFRRLKYLEDANEKREIQSAALKFQAPSNLIPWMTFNLDVSKVKHKRIAQGLFKKSSRDLFKKLEQIVTDFESLSSEEWSKDTKRSAENIDSQVDLDSTLNFFHSSRDLKIEEKKSISPKMKKHKPKKKSKNKRKRKSKSETVVNLNETHSLAINEKFNENVNLGLTPSSQTTINGTSLNLDDTNSLAFHEACNKNVNLSLQPSSQKLDTLLCNPVHKLNVEDCQVPLSSEKNEAITENNIIIAKTEKRKTFSLSKKLNLGKTLKTSRKKIKLFNNDEFESSRKLVEMHPNNEVVSDVNEPAKITSLSISTNMNSTRDVNTLQASLNFPKGKMMSSHNKTALNIFSVSEVREKSCGKTVEDMVAKEQVYSHDDAEVSLYNTCSAPLFDSMPGSSTDMGNSFEASINNSTQVHSNLNNSFSNNSLEAKILYKKTSVSEDTCGRDKNDANTVYDETIDHIANQTSTHLMQDLNIINPDSQITADNVDFCRDDSVITREEPFNFENNAKTFEQLCNSFNSVTNWVSNSNSDSVAQNAPMQRISCIGIEGVRFSESQNLNETGAMCKNTVKVGANEFTFPQREGILHQSANTTGDQNTFVIDCNIVNNASNHTQSETMSKNPEISSIKVIINLNNKKHSDNLLLQNKHAGNSKLTTKSLSSHASANSFTDHFNVSQKTGSSSQVLPQYNGYRSSSHEGNYSRNDEHYSGNDFSQRQPANNYTSSKNRFLSGKTYRNSAIDIYSDDSCDISLSIMGGTSDEENDNSFIKALHGHSSSESPLKNKDLGSNNHSRMRTISSSTFEYHSNAEMFNLNGDKTSNFKRPLTPKCRTPNSFEKAKIVRRKANKTVDRKKLPQKTVTTVKPCDKTSNFKRPLTPKCRTSNSFEKAKIVRRKANKTVDRKKLPQKTVTTVKPCAYNLRSRKKSISIPSKFKEYIVQNI